MLKYGILGAGYAWDIGYGISGLLVMIALIKDGWIKNEIRKT
jgi:Na+-driven multidrug efflux pump